MIEALFGSRPYLRHLEAEIEWLKHQLAHERARAEQAIDRLLQRAAVAPVSLPLPPAGVPEEWQELLKQPEFSDVGQGP
jgi:hypothetical protein